MLYQEIVQLECNLPKTKTNTAHLKFKYADYVAVEFKIIKLHFFTNGISVAKQ